MSREPDHANNPATTDQAQPDPPVIPASSTRDVIQDLAISLGMSGAAGSKPREGSTAEAFERLREASRSQQDLAPPGTAQPKLARPKQQTIPYWPDEKRPAIHAYVRSSLFSAAKGERRYMRNEPVLLQSLPYFDLTFTGEELRQHEHQVLLQILHIARGQNLEQWIILPKRRQFVQAIGWHPNGDYYQRLDKAIERMQICRISITIRREDGVSERYHGPIILEIAERGEEEGGLAIKLNPAFANLLAPGQYSTVLVEKISGLNDLGQWLLWFMSSHRPSFRSNFTVQQLHDLSGLDYKELRYFRRDLSKTLERMEGAGILKSHLIHPSGRVAVEFTDALDQLGDNKG